MDEQPDKETLERQLAEERAERAAAAAAEPEPNDDDQVVDDDDDQEEPTGDEPEEPSDDDDRSDELRAEQLGLVVDGFEAALRDVLGADEKLDPVPMDGAIGFMVPGALELKAHAKFRRCSTCNGHGQVLTGSLADQRQTTDCPRCAGRGYLEKTEELAGDGEQDATNGDGAVDPDAGFGVPKWMGDPAVGQS